MFNDGLRTAGIAIAHILMSAATVYLNEIVSGLSSKAAPPAKTPQASTGASTASLYADICPPEDDHQGRREFGLRQLREGIYPLLQAMGRYRAAPQQLVERLTQAEQRRISMVQRREDRQHAQEDSPDEQAESTSSMELNYLADSTGSKEHQNTVNNPSVLSSIPDSVWQMPGSANSALAVLTNAPPFDWYSDTHQVHI